MDTPSDLSDPIYNDDEAARAHLEAIRWPNGVHCPLCGNVEHVRSLRGESMGPGWFYCPACKDKFTVRTKSIYERSHIPLHKWLLAFRLMASSKKGISAHQLHRMLGITYKSAWFLAHRIREAMIPENTGALGGPGGAAVEADETYIGKERPLREGEHGPQHKRKVISLVERGGAVRSFHVKNVDKVTVGRILAKNVDPEAHLITDDAIIYTTIGRWYASHSTVNHSAKEYARGEVHTNTIEGVFSIFKRGMIGIYQHCGEQHLQRYLAEFDFRYSNRVALGVDDAERTTRALKGAPGKRLTYKQRNISAA